jgi:hypothetical protein
MGRWRDSITGLFTTRAKAEANPDTTQAVTLLPPVEVGGRIATHYCRDCGALWRELPPDRAFPDGSWTLVSNACGKCCDNAPMGSQIVAFNGRNSHRDRSVREAERVAGRVIEQLRRVEWTPGVRVERSWVGEHNRVIRLIMGVEER